MLKLLLTADNHIGLKYAGHEKGALLAQKRITALTDMVQYANRSGCGLFLIAGDLFENTYGISQRDAAHVLDILSGFGGVTAILPGNHDYYDRDSRLWQSLTSLSAERDNILLLTEARPYSLHVNDTDVMLYPAPCFAAHSEANTNHLDWIRDESIPSDGTICIGIAHGSVQGETPDREGIYYPMTRKELEELPMDLWCLGHTHVPFPAGLCAESAPTAERIFNPGTHVQTDVSCATEGLCFLLEADEKKQIRARAFHSGSIRFFRRTVSFAGTEMEQTLLRALADIGDDSVVDLILTGAVEEEDYRCRDEIVTRVLSRFTEGTYRDHALSRRIRPELIDAEFPETSFSARFLHALLEDPKEAQLAYELLCTLKEEQKR